ncbi:hypothetical protein NDU88_003444 [Pleurodeles waltl]|uniref:Uncharacterized protein n=1 Tax=Pleurodeles waltl TaxID=8319 RepID=A0AAV7L614_PLEWA|nr:hypothetical protein NDU88_003444 [Pleurodeles waltl]
MPSGREPIRVPWKSPLQRHLGREEDRGKSGIPESSGASRGSNSTRTTSGTPGSSGAPGGSSSTGTTRSVPGRSGGPGGRTTRDPAMLWGERGIGRFTILLGPACPGILQISGSISHILGGMNVMGRLRPGRSRHTPGAPVLKLFLTRMPSGWEPIRIHFRVPLGLEKPFALLPGEREEDRGEKRHSREQRRSKRQGQHRDHKGHSREQRWSKRQQQHRDHQRHSRKQWRSRRQQQHGTTSGAPGRSGGPGGRTTRDPATLWGERGLGRYLGLGTYAMFSPRDGQEAGAGQAGS